MSDIKKIKNEYLAKLNEHLDLNLINQIKTDLFGKNGLISNKFKQLGNAVKILNHNSCRATLNINLK